MPGFWERLYNRSISGVLDAVEGFVESREGIQLVSKTPMANEVISALQQAGIAYLDLPSYIRTTNSGLDVVQLARDTIFTDIVIPLDANQLALRRPAALDEELQATVIGLHNFAQMVTPQFLDQLKMRMQQSGAITYPFLNRVDGQIRREEPNLPDIISITSADGKRIGSHVLYGALMSHLLYPNDSREVMRLIFVPSVKPYEQLRNEMIQGAFHGPRGSKNYDARSSFGPAFPLQKESTKS